MSDADDARDKDDEQARLNAEIVRLFGEPIAGMPIFDPEAGIYPVED